MESRTSNLMEMMSSISLSDVKGFLKRHLFILLTIGAVIMGIILGFGLRSHNLSPREIIYFSFPGELLMRMLKMVALPLIISCLITGISSLDIKVSGKIAVCTGLYYLLTTLIAVILGIVVVLIIQPGKGIRDTPVNKGGNTEYIQATDVYLDLMRNMFPPNLVEACFSMYKTVYKKIVHTRNVTANITNSQNVTEPQTIEETVEEMLPDPGSSGGVNAMGLVVFSLCFGFVISGMKHQGRAIKDFFFSLNEAIMRLVHVIIWYIPVGITFLIAGNIIEMKNMTDMGRQVGMYTLTVTVGLFIHGVIILPSLFFVVTKRKPYIFISGLLQALITALGTSSSSATLPITFRCLEENNHVDKRVTRFIIPVGATVNMDGTALYETVAAIFIAQVNYMDLNLSQILTISITATVASIGVAAIPQSGPVTMVIVLASVGLPTDDIAVIIIVDWLLDRFCTVINVLGDSVGAGIVEHLCWELLQDSNVEARNSVIEENEKLYQVVCQDNNNLNQLNNETTM